MTTTTADLMTFGGQGLPFAQDLREALANFARRTWPTNTSGHMAKAWGISKDTAKNVLKGHASDATVTKIIRAGGWSVALPVIGAVIGQPVETFFREQIKKAAREAERAVEHEQLAAAAYRSLAARSANPGPDRDAAASAREARSFTGKVGLEAPRRVAGGDQ